MPINLRAVTLTEILVIIIIIGIVSALALPSYTTSRERTLAKEAISSLKLISASQKQYNLETGFYFTGYNNSIPWIDNTTQINRALHLDLKDRYWSYNISTTDVPPATEHFKAEAYRDGAGGYLDCIYYIWENMTDPEPHPDVIANCP